MPWIEKRPVFSLSHVMLMGAKRLRRGKEPKIRLIYLVAVGEGRILNRNVAVTCGHRKGKNRDFN